MRANCPNVLQIGGLWNEINLNDLILLVAIEPLQVSLQNTLVPRVQLNNLRFVLIDLKVVLMNEVLAQYQSQYLLEVRLSTAIGADDDVDVVVEAQLGTSLVAQHVLQDESINLQASSRAEEARVRTPNLLSIPDLLLVQRKYCKNGLAGC
jgi:hypothetical protein